MADWKTRGKIAQLRYEIWKDKVRYYKGRLGMFKCDLQLRWLGWKYKKVKQLKLLAESRSFRDGDSDE
jgi:hypothetical protein